MKPEADSKTSAKAMIREVIEAQPEDATYEEIMRELAFERMVERGLADVLAGCGLPHNEALRRIRAWRSRAGRWRRWIGWKTSTPTLPGIRVPWRAGHP